jgi:hypothetical protein
MPAVLRADRSIPVMAGLVAGLSGLISLYRRHCVDASGSGSDDSEWEHERGTTSRRAMMPSGSGSYPAVRAIALPDFSHRESGEDDRGTEFFAGKSLG